jgi:hypothetical protein
MIKRSRGATVRSLFLIASLAGGSAAGQDAPAPPGTAAVAPAPAPAPPPGPEILHAIPDTAQQKAQRQAVQDIGNAQKDLKASASDLGSDASVESINRLQARAARLASQAAGLQISDPIAPTNTAVVPEIKPLLDLRAKAVALKTAIQDEAQRIKDADPARDAEMVRGLIDQLENDVATFRDTTREADRQLDRLRAIYLSSASLVVSGGVSLGSYQAGFLHYYTQYLLLHGRYARQFFTGDNGASLDQVGGFKLVTGASAGSINGFLAAVAGCRKAVADPEKSLFYKAWIPVGMDRLADSNDVTVDGLLSRKPIDDAVDMIERLWNDPGERTGWDACNAYLGFSVTRLHGRTLDFPEKVGDHVDNGAAAVAMVRLTEKFVLRMTGPAGAPPTFASFRPQPRDPKEEPPPELYPTLGVGNSSRVASLDALPARLGEVMTLLEASSSFPFAFPPVELPLTVWHQQPAAPAAPGAPPAQPVYVAAPEPAAQMIDGGVFDNTPLGLAIRMGEWMPHAPARYLFLVSDNVAWRPPGPPPAPPKPDAKPSHPGTTIDAYGPFVSGFISASEDTELMNTVEGHGDINRELPARQLPVAGEQLGHFMAFFERDFRIFDFYMGMVDAHDHIASHNAEQLGMLKRAGANLMIASPTYSCFLAHRRQAATITYDAIAALPECRGVDGNLIALLKASTKIRREAQARKPVNDQLQQFFDALDEFGYQFKQLTYRGSAATGATAKRAVRDTMQDLAHDLSAKQDGEGNKFVVSITSKAVPNLFLYRPPRFYLAVGLDTDAGGELQQGFELGQLSLFSRPSAVRLTLSERAREFDRSKLDPATSRFTYAATFMGAAHMVWELPISNVFQLELGAGAAISERVGWQHDAMLWRWGPEGVVRLDLLQRFFLGASFLYYLDDCAGNNRCSHVPAQFQTLPNAISAAQYKIWLSVGTRFFWFN